MLYIFVDFMSGMCAIYSNWLLVIGKKDVEILLAYNKNSTDWRVGFKNKHLIIIVLEVKKSESKAQTL